MDKNELAKAWHEPPDKVRVYLRGVPFPDFPGFIPRPVALRLALWVWKWRYWRLGGNPVVIPAEEGNVDNVIINPDLTPEQALGIVSRLG